MARGPKTLANRRNTSTLGSNRAAVLYGPHDLRLEDRPLPRPAPHEVLVAVKAVGVCGSDVHYYEHGAIGAFVVRAPLVLGHEVSGVVVATGTGATAHAIGQRVTLEPGVPCGRCRECGHGRYNLCRDVRFFGTPPVDGAFQNYVAIDERFAHALPDELSDDDGALIEPLSVGVWACRKAGITAGSRVLVTGAGPIGVLAMQVALASGAVDVTVADVNPHRLGLARSLGASRAVNVTEEPLRSLGLSVDALIECSGNEDALAEGIRSLRPAGVAVAVGMTPGESASIPLAAIQNSEITLTGVFRYANTYPEAISLVRIGRVNLTAIVTGHYGLEETETALRMARSDPLSIKRIVAPGLPA